MVVIIESLKYYTDYKPVMEPQVFTKPVNRMAVKVKRNFENIQEQEEVPA